MVRDRVCECGETPAGELELRVRASRDERAIGGDDVTDVVSGVVDVAVLFGVEAPNAAESIGEAGAGELAVPLAVSREALLLPPSCTSLALGVFASDTVTSMGDAITEELEVDERMETAESVDGRVEVGVVRVVAR